MNLIPVNIARKFIEKEIFQTKIIEKKLEDSLYHYLAENIYAPINIPPFDNSAMDGYALLYEDFINKEKLHIKYTIKAGDSELPLLKKGEVARIFTGAPIPTNADTVIMQEKVDINNSILHIKESCKKGENIRLKGSQSKKGELIIPKNTKINTGVIAILAGLGIEWVKVYSFPKVAIIVTGNELIESGNSLENGQIYESNSITLKSALKDLHINEAQIIKTIDDKEVILTAIKNLFDDKIDILLITGGISVGDYDFVKECLMKVNVKDIFYKIAQKPGKPLLFGKKDNQYVFGLPGNPASVLSCFYQYIRPFIEGLKGRKDFLQEQGYAILSSDFEQKSQLTHFLKGKEYNGVVDIMHSQESYKMDSFMEANCLIEIPGEKKILTKGQTVTIWRI